MSTDSLLMPLKDKMLHGMAAHEGQSVVVLSQVSIEYYGRMLLYYGLLEKSLMTMLAHICQ